MNSATTNNPHPLPNGTPVRCDCGSGHTSTGVICDHESRDIGGDRPSIFYHVAMEWPRKVEGFEMRLVKPLLRKTDA